MPVNEEWLLEENMADQIKRLKNLRKNKLAAFTRKQKHLSGLVETELDVKKLTEVFAELKGAFSNLEDAHDQYSGVEEELVLEGEGDYLEEPSQVLNDLDGKVTTKVKQLEDVQNKEAFKSSWDLSLVKLKNNIAGFGCPSKFIGDLCTENRISFTDMRLELTKIEESYNKLLQEKVDLLNMDSSYDANEVLELFKTKVAEEYDRCKATGFAYMKDADTSVTTSATGGGVETTLSAGTSHSTTKRETVMLPHFSGDEKTAFLKYPVWKKQWDNHIKEYEVKYRSTMLLNHLDEKAQLQIIGNETDYDAAILQLDRYYSDAKKVIRACLDDIKSHPQVSQFDYKALVQYKKCLLNNHSRLKACSLEHEMSNTAAMGVLLRKFPIQEAVDFQKFLSEQSTAEQNQPFPSFIRWLEKAGSSWELLAASGTGVRGKSGNAQVHMTFYGEEESDTAKNKRVCYKCGKEGHMKKDCTSKENKNAGGGKGSSSSGKKPRLPPKNKKHHCAYHKDAKDRFCSTWSCPSLKYVPYTERIKLLKENQDCELCCGDCPRGNCLAKNKRICGGNKDGRGCGVSHVGHELWCANAKVCFAVSNETVLRTTGPPEDPVLLQVMKIPSLDNSKEHETVLWDTACTGFFVRNDHANEMQFPCKKETLRVITLGGDVKEIEGLIYDCQIKDLRGNVHNFQAHGLDEVTGVLNTVLGENLMRRLFPDVIGGYQMCGATRVDYLIGLGKASWQPQRSIKAKGGGDFWIWTNDFGSCVGGSHPWVNNLVSRSDNLYNVLKVVGIDSVYDDSWRIPTCVAYQTKVSVMDMDNFFQMEKLCTMVEPKCGACRCGHCPVPGSRYSFREENELRLIEDNMRYDDDKRRWVASYPYLFPRESLRGSKEVAIRSMQSTERMLSKKGEWADVYRGQIQDMIDRKVAKIVPEEELSSYKGHVNYLPHLAVVNPKSASTPVRICFDASRSQGGGPSLNDVLAKGPDRFLNNLASVIIRFRNGAEVAKGDVRKMYNSVLLEPADCFVQCFLWRDMDLQKEPVTYQVIVNNIGVKPAGCIATTALYKSSDSFKEQYPITAFQLKNNSYVDDVGLTGKNRTEVKMRTQEADNILAHAGMEIKSWVFSGDEANSMEIGDIDDNLPLGEKTSLERMLGVVWDPKQDVFRFQVKINLSALKKKTRTGPDLTLQDLLSNPPLILTRRQYYSQVQSLFDPIGLLSPVLLTAKILLRKTWEEGCEKLSWDDALPPSLVQEMVTFFIQLFELEDIVFTRSLIPKTGEVVGKPELILFSDGSVIAFGAVGYIRWKMRDGTWWTNLILSKSKIAPKNRLTVPRLELNGAVLSKRLEEFVVSSLGVEFENIFHLVDSSTVLGYLHKSDAKLKPFEGIRVSEIQTAGTFINGRLHNYFWVEGQNNPADWATKPRSVTELKSGGFWQSGPEFLRMDVSKWPVKVDFRMDKLEGELQPKGVHMVLLVSDGCRSMLGDLLERSSNTRKLIRIVAYGFKWVLSRSSDQDSVNGVRLPQEALTRSKELWLKFVQQDLIQEIELSAGGTDRSKVSGRFKKLAPFQDESGLWRVGLRIREYTPFTVDHKPPVLLPYDHRFTKLLMYEAHEKRHGGVSDTVAEFRLAGYWVPKAKNLARSIKEKCVICRYLDHNPVGQIMGNIPKSTLVQPVAWGHVQLDLFGPFICRSEVNKRSTKKVWGMILIDVNSKAMHCDIVLDYSGQEVIKTLRRFGSLRGWPCKITSDPGSQLVGASGDMASWWNTLSEDLQNQAEVRNFTWETSPADSPWRQGQCEVSIKQVKRLLKIAIGDVKLTPSELQTALFEVANLCNEKPIGVNSSPEADGSFKVLTPNCLTMGRSSNAVPDDSNLAENMKHSERYRLIEQVTADYWKRWTAEITPLHVIRQKWHESKRNLKIGDLVLVHDKSPIKGKYTLAIVDEVKISTDGFVRSCVLKYSIPHAKDSTREYSGSKEVKITRSVQRISLLLPIEEQCTSLVVSEGLVKEDKRTEVEKLEVN